MYNYAFIIIIITLYIHYISDNLIWHTDVKYNNTVYRLNAYRLLLRRHNICVPKFVLPANLIFTKHTSKGETVCIDYISQLFNAKFNKIRPKWLINNCTGRSLELDGFYNKIAIEYNGMQHYKFVPYFHKTYNEFKQQLYRDKLKKELCIRNKVYLLIVPYWICINDIPAYIYCKLIENQYTKYLDVLRHLRISRKCNKHVII
jgi:hypothetical protein